MHQFTIENQDGRGLQCRRWGNQDGNLAFVVVHRLGEHRGCYDEFADAMALHSRATYVYDEYGHAKSPGVRGHAPSLSRSIDDVQTVCLRVANERHDAEIVLLGHNVGGHFVLKFLLDENQPPIFRAIVINPMILPENPPMKPQSFAAWPMSKTVSRVRVLADIDPTGLTRDPDIA